MRHRPAILLLALAACSRPPRPTVESGAAIAADTVAQGTVRMVGPTETAQVILRGDSASVGLTGPLAGELRRLAGATVRVSGTPGNNTVPAPSRAVAVADYEVLDVDGQVPLVGIVLSRSGRLWLAGRDTVELLAAASDLGARPGAKVFVVGVLEGGRLRVRSYGIIRDARD